MRNIAILALAALVVAVNGSSNLRVQMEAEVEAHNEKKSSWMFSHKPARKEMMRLTVAIRVDDDVVQKIRDPQAILARRLVHQQLQKIVLGQTWEDFFLNKSYATTILTDESSTCDPKVRHL